MVILRYHHTGVVSENADKLAEFYEHGLGLRLIGKFERRGAGIDAVVGYHKTRIRGLLMEGPDQTRIEIIEYLNPRASARHSGERNVVGGCHLAFEVTNLRGEHERLVALGAKPLNQPGWLTEVKLASYLQDPDGNWLELFETFE